MYEILNNQEIEKICHLLECDQAELKNLFDDSKKINESSKTVYQKIMKILQKGANVREAGVFSEINLTFPILILRNSLFIIDKKIKINLSKLNLSADKFLKNLNDIEKKIIIAENNFDELHNENQEIKKIFDAIKFRFKDLHLEESINSEYQKVNKSIKKISKKIVRGFKKRNEILINRVEFLRNRFTPKNSLQERNDSLIQYYAVYGENFMKMLKDNLNPLDNNFLFLETDD